MTLMIEMPIIQSLRIKRKRQPGSDGDQQMLSAQDVLAPVDQRAHDLRFDCEDNDAAVGQIEVPYRRSVEPSRSDCRCSPAKIIGFGNEDMFSGTTPR